MITLAFAVASAQLAAMQRQESRVLATAYRLQQSGYRAQLCSDSMPLAGFVLHDRAQYPASMKPALVDHFGLGSRPAVLAVVARSPADRAGVSRGQSIYGINEIGVEETPERASGFGPLAKVEALIDASEGDIRITAKADVSRIVSTFAPERGCRSRVQIVPGRKLNASADGFYVQLTNPVISETADDDELAFVIAHEMAHNILRHVEKPGPKRVEEDEADQLGLKLMHAAGYDPQAAARFWTRFGAKTGAGIFSDGSHRRTKSRVAFLTAEAAKLTQ